MPGQRNSDQRNHVVDEDQQDGQHESAGLAAFLRRQAERDADQREHQAGGGQGEALVEGDEIPAGGDGIDAGGLLPEGCQVSITSAGSDSSGLFSVEGRSSGMSVCWNVEIW